MTTNNNYDVSPWLVSQEIVQAKTKDPPILRKSVITTQL